ncbi:MAG: hypothetical protein ACYTHJ_22465, partial [Planctomycetota bacterium]
MKLAIAMAGPATGFGFFTIQPHLLIRADEPEHRTEVPDGRHAREIRAGYFIDRGYVQRRLGPR